MGVAMSKINVIQLPSEYKAEWWFNGITNRATEIAEWVKL